MLPNAKGNTDRLSIGDRPALLGNELPVTSIDGLTITSPVEEGGDVVLIAG